MVIRMYLNFSLVFFRFIVNFICVFCLEHKSTLFSFFHDFDFSNSTQYSAIKFSFLVSFIFFFLENTILFFKKYKNYLFNILIKLLPVFLIIEISLFHFNSFIHQRCLQLIIFLFIVETIYKKNCWKNYKLILPVLIVTLFFKSLFFIPFVFIFIFCDYLNKHFFSFTPGLLLISVSIWGYINFDICQFDQVLTLFQFGKKGYLTADLSVYYIFGNIFISTLCLPVFSFYLKESYVEIVSNSFNLRRFSQILFSCIYVFFASEVYKVFVSIWKLMQSSGVSFIAATFFIMILVLVINVYSKYFKINSIFLSFKKEKYISVIMIFFGFYIFFCEYNFASYLHQLISSFDTKTTSDEFKKYYKDPRSINFQMAKNPKSLILIYVESLESTYRDKNLFQKNLLQSLDNLNYSKIHFNHFNQVSGTGWTMAGILASQCGIPYKVMTVFDGNRQGEYLRRFIPGAHCLGDILHAYGYQNIFMNGSSLKFAGQGLFFKTHHYDETYGREYWKRNGYADDNLKFWGLSDDFLFEEAKLKLNQLMQKSKLFNLTILTIDTHGIDGRLSNSCIQRGGKNFEDIVECTSVAISDFVNYVAQQGWLDRVSIVITGDHLAMQNAISYKLSQRPKHYIYNLIITKDKLKKSRDNIVHFDLFPTILHSLGFKWDNDKLGLGYSALGEINPKLSPKKRIDKLEKIILSHSNTYNNLWLKD